ncbi:redoxin domain-containing protein [Sphingobacterium sp. xlx-130]|uniref:redoxin domain-containing protein n=1 Tax=Sphingobacterium sp. xlx-130 TaxID=2654323 RepID=UPI0013DD5824|nr:redoxin domain-containing protein [Sphingobacterium sp. xlx-130]
MKLIYFHLVVSIFLSCQLARANSYDSKSQNKVKVNESSIGHAEVQRDTSSLRLFLKSIKDNNLTDAIKYQNQIDDTDKLRYSLVDMVLGLVNKQEASFRVSYLRDEIKVMEKAPAAMKRFADPSILTLKGELAKALQELGQCEEAVQLAGEVYKAQVKPHVAYNRIYGELLAKCGKYEKALPLLSSAVAAGLSSDEVNNLLEKSYHALGNKDFNAYLRGLNKKFTDSLKQHFASTMMNNAAPDFFITDLKGRKVTKEDLKGKVLVLDFWATWCGPCKGSFPAMQAAVNKFKDDKDVRFLFIHTFERAANATTAAKKYLDDNNYNFELFMDLKNTSTRKNTAASAFGITGIPTKFIIDKKGNVRFKSVGGGASIDKVVAELSTMIELAKS